MAFIKIIEKIGNAWKKEYEETQFTETELMGLRLSLGKS